MTTLKTFDPQVAAESYEAERVLELAARKARENASRTAPKQIGGLVGIGSPPELSEAQIEFLAARQRHEDTREQRERQSRIGELMKVCGVPARYMTASIGEVDHLPEGLRADYARETQKLANYSTRPCIIALCGARGPGKTYAACATVLRFCRELKSARYAVLMDYFATIRAEYNKKDGDESKAERQFIYPQLLVLDEIQVRGESEWENRMFTRLLDARYADLKTTILISNEDRAKMLTNVGDSIRDRIKDGGGIISFNWQSLRGKLDGEG